MTFAAETLKPVSEKFILVRMTPRKWLGTGASLGGNHYLFTTGTDRVDQVQINGVTISTADWTFDGTNINVYSLLDLTTGNYVTIDKNIFLTGSKLRDTTQNAGVLPAEIWEPVIKEYPTWAQSMRNISEGVFSLSNTEINVISTDRWLQDMLTPDWSFNRANVYIWACINDTSNNRVIFNGEVVSANISQGFVNFQIIDGFQKLDETATFGSQDQTYAHNGATYTSVLPSQYEGKPIPLIIGKTSPIIIQAGYRVSEAFGTPANTPMYHLDDGLDCIPTTASLNTATSVTFLCGRILVSTIKALTFGTISAAYVHYLTKDVIVSDNAGGTLTAQVTSKFVYLNCSDFNGEIGDYVKSVHSSGVTYGFVCGIGTFTHAATSFNVAINCGVEYESYFPSLTSGSFAVPSPTGDSMSVWIPGEGDASYTGSYTPLSINPYYIRATFAGRYVPFTISYGTAYSFGGRNVKHVYATVSSSNLNGELPGKYQFKCRFGAGSGLSHGEAMEFICKSAGLSTNSSTFTQANTDLSAKVVMSSPPFKSGDFPKYLDLAQSIAKSTFGTLRINADREVEYQIFKDPQGETATGTRDSVNMIDGSTSVNVEYQDIYSDVSFTNPQYINLDNLSTSAGPSALTSNLRAKYLHKVNKTKRFEHVLENIYNSKNVITGYLAAPTVEYTVSTASEDLTTEIGDILEVDNKIVPYSTQTRNGYVTDIQSGTTQTKIKINELRGI